MRGIKLDTPIGLTLFVAAWTVLLCLTVIILLNQVGLIHYTGGGWMVATFNLIMGFLGYSIPFFVLILFGYSLFTLFLKRSLERFQIDPEEIENIRFYNGGIDIFVTLFFAIGVLFTAWGLQNALVAAIGGVSKAEAGQLGAWGILKRLVDNGILIALWTTIVGGAGGYLMRLFKYIYFAKPLARVSSQTQEAEKTEFFAALEAIRLQVERIEQKMNGSE